MGNGQQPFGMVVGVGIYLGLRCLSRCRMHMLTLFYFSGKGVGEVFVFETAQMVGRMGLHHAPAVVVIEGGNGILGRIV